MRLDNVFLEFVRNRQFKPQLVLFYGFFIHVPLIQNATEDHVGFRMILINFQHLLQILLRILQRAVVSTV